MQSFLQYLRDSVRHQELVLLSFIAALWVRLTPLQHYIALSKYQHYSLSMFAVSTGFLLQTVISWRVTGKWGRVTMLFSTFYIASFANTFWANPWLGNANMETEYQTMLRHYFMLGYMCGAVVFAGLWTIWAVEKHRAYEQKLKAAQETVTS